MLMCLTGPGWHSEWLPSSLLWQSLWVCWLSVSDPVWWPQRVQTQVWVPRVSLSPCSHPVTLVVTSVVILWYFFLECGFVSLVCFHVNFLLHSLKEFLPKEYIKHKGEKKIFQVRTVLCWEQLLLQKGQKYSCHNFQIILWFKIYSFCYVKGGSQFYISKYQQWVERHFGFSKTQQCSWKQCIMWCAEQHHTTQEQYHKCP